MLPSDGDDHVVGLEEWRLGRPKGSSVLPTGMEPIAGPSTLPTISLRVHGWNLHLRELLPSG
jgi:hypothetical protein